MRYWDYLIIASSIAGKASIHKIAYSFQVAQQIDRFIGDIVAVKSGTYQILKRYNHINQLSQ